MRSQRCSLQFQKEGLGVYGAPRSPGGLRRSQGEKLAELSEPPRAFSVGLDCLSNWLQRPARGSAANVAEAQLAADAEASAAARTADALLRAGEAILKLDHR